MEFKNLPDFSGYTSFGISAGTGKHTVCNVSLVIAPEKAEEYFQAAEQRKHIEVCSDSGDCVMSGIISAVSVDYRMTRTTADITITSESLLLQEKGKERIFQNPKKTYIDILKTFPEVETGKCDRLNDTVEDIIYQHGTDDFSFLLYLAGRCGTGLWITDDGKVSFGLINNKKTFSENSTVYRKSLLERRITATKNGRSADILTMEQIPCGSLMVCGQTEYTVCGVEVHEEHNEVYFRYRGFTAPEYETINQKPLVTTAEVTANNDPEGMGRIQVRFTEFEDNSSEKTWIPYLSGFTGNSGAGIVMLPDVDDVVFVVISQGRAYAVNSVRSKAIPEKFRNAERKYIAVNDSVLSIAEEIISAEHGESISAVIDKDSVVIKTENAELKISPESLRAELEKSSVIVSPDDISAENGKGKLNISDGSFTAEGGKSRLLLNDGKTGLGGNEIDFST